jgi:hypothetical protein
MRSSEYCFSHDPASARRRAAARRAGGKAKAEAARAAREPEAEATASVAALVPFDLGALRTLAEIVAATEKVAHAVAAGELDTRRARLLRELLSEAYQRRADSQDGVADDAREPTDDELTFIVSRGGPPPGVEVVTRPMRVRGPVWSPDVVDHPESLRPLTRVEAEYYRAHAELPPGLRLIIERVLLVVGPSWRPPPSSD